MFPKVNLVDLSIPIKNPADGEMDPTLQESLACVTKYLTHEDTAGLVSGYFGCEKDDLLGGVGWATERIRLSSHSGTHIDAPYHYFFESGGKPSNTITECPLEWFFGNGVVLDMRHIPDGETAQAGDIEQALEKIDHKLSYGDIACIRFDTDKKFGTKEYWSEYPGLSAEAVRYILDQGVKVIGVDSPGFDIPFSTTKKKFAQSKDRAILWEAHRAGIPYDYSHIEKLANLDKVPPKGFWIVCFPVHIYKASAAWARVVAMVPQEL